MVRTLTHLLCAAALQITASAGAAAAYPERTITLIVPVAPGGPADALARTIAPYVERHLGNNAKIAVLNRAGASGQIGFAAIAGANPDGYTFGMIFMTPLLPPAQRSEAKISLRDFELLGNVIVDPVAFAVVEDSPLRTLADLVAQASAEPQAVTIGTSGAGSGDDVSITLLEEQAKVDITHVHFKGASEVRQAMLGRFITAGALKVSEIAQMRRAGIDIRSLGQAAHARSPFVPDVPTLRELGYDIVMSSVRGFAAPRNLPDDVRTKLVSAIQRAAEDPEFQHRASHELFQPLTYVSPQAIRQQGACLAPGCPPD